MQPAETAQASLFCTCFLVDLDGRLVSLDPDNLSDELIMSNTALERTLWLVSMTEIVEGVTAAYQFVHGASNHVLGHDDRAGDREDGAIFILRGFKALSLLGRRRHLAYAPGVADRVCRWWRGLLDTARAVVGGGRVGERWQVV